MIIEILKEAAGGGVQADPKVFKGEDMLYSCGGGVGPIEGSSAGGGVKLHHLGLGG